MSAATSPTTGRAYGLRRVCAAFGRSRSTCYAQGARQKAGDVVSKRRGPVPSVSDAELLAHVRKDLETSPFVGEGHRKVWARLRVRDELRVARKRVLRIMRENNLLSPHRLRQQGEERLHDGEITTDRPGEMWGTDGARVFTVEDGWVWIFSAVEHWNAECVGHHVCKIGSRYAALEPIAMGVQQYYGSLAADAARGLALRMDHGTQCLADHFLDQIKFWGISKSFAFIEEPQTNGVAERFNRTLKEQVVHGRIFQGVEDLRQAVAAFVQTYNTEWRLEKLGFKSPIEARMERAQGVAA